MYKKVIYSKYEPSNKEVIWTNGKDYKIFLNGKWKNLSIQQSTNDNIPTFYYIKVKYEQLNTNIDIGKIEIPTYFVIEYNYQIYLLHFSYKNNVESYYSNDVFKCCYCLDRYLSVSNNINISWDKEYYIKTIEIKSYDITNLNNNKTLSISHNFSLIGNSVPLILILRIGLSTIYLYRVQNTIFKSDNIEIDNLTGNKVTAVIEGTKLNLFLE